MLKIVLKNMAVFNKISLTQEEEDCILHFLRKAEDDVQSSDAPTINSIFVKYWN